MEDVPKIVRQRLKVTGPLVSHPDADTLTAFAERSLSSRERAGVLEHLSRCADCREVVALALPASESETVLSPSPRRALAWPALRWGFAAAGLVVVVSLGVLQYQRRTAQDGSAHKAPQATTTQAKNETLPPVPPEPSREQDKAAIPTGPSAAVPHAKQLEATAGQPRDEEKVSAGPLVGGAGSRDTFAHGPSTLNQLQSNANTQQQAQTLRSAPVPPPPPRALAGNVPAPSVQAEAQSAFLNSRPGNSDATQAQTSEQTSAYNYADAKVEKTKPLETTISNTSPSAAAAPSVAPTAGRSIVALTAVNANWRITSTGGLQRSLDQGNSWQDVNVQGYATVVGGNFKKARPSLATAKKDASDLGNPITFRAVSANGADVWAGASSALLYHSTDAGNHWTLVAPSANSTTLTGDIVSLSFPDALHGTVSTSTSQVWTTSDGGQTWQQQ